MQTYINQLTTILTAIAQNLATAQTLIDTYFDRGYNAGAANEITAEDLAALGITPTQLAGAITLLQQLQALRHGGAVVPGDYDAVLNQLRRDL